MLLQKTVWLSLGSYRSNTVTASSSNSNTNGSSSKTSSTVNGSSYWQALAIISCFGMLQLPPRQSVDQWYFCKVCA